VLRLLADEDFDGDITRGLLRQVPGLDLVRVQDIGLRGAPDPAVLAWAAREGRVVVTHDANTMISYAYARVRASQPMAGLFVLGQDVPPGAAIEEILLLAECSEESEWEGQVLHLPL
jgi:predicted nuclease of predicted toxin-antitoxin system